MKIGILFIENTDTEKNSAFIFSFLSKLSFIKKTGKNGAKEIISEISPIYKENEFINLNDFYAKTKGKELIINQLYFVNNLLEKKEIDKMIIISKEPLYPFMYLAKFKDNIVGFVDNIETTKLTIEHNNANILIVDSNKLLKSDIFAIIKTFIESIFEKKRHQFRIDILTKGVK